MKKAIAIQPKAIWAQLGIVDEGAALVVEGVGRNNQIGGIMRKSCRVKHPDRGVI